MRVKRSLVFVLLIMAILLLSACDLGLLTSKYSVEGQVTDEYGNGIEGVTITLSGGMSGTATTDANGKWEMNNLKGQVTVTATLNSWTFTPPTVSVSAARTDVNFVGVQSAEAGALQVVDAFCQGLLSWDIEAVADLFDESYLAANGMTRKECMQDISAKYFWDSASYITMSYRVDYVNSTFDTENVSLKGLLDSTKLYYMSISNDTYYTFDLVKRSVGWKIVNMFEYSPEEAEIKVLDEQFLNALVNEDLTVITSMLANSPQSQSYVISKFETLFNDYDFNSYTVTSEKIINKWGDNRVNIDVTLNITELSGASYDDQAIVELEYTQKNFSWLLSSITIRGSSINF